MNNSESKALERQGLVVNNSISGRTIHDSGNVVIVVVDCPRNEGP
jgi:hypothetical protein